MVETAFLRHEFRLAPWWCLFAATAVVVSLFLAQGTAIAGNSSMALAQGQRQVIVVPDVDPMRGRRLFVLKGCVVCHAIKGVGGKAAPALDAPEAGLPVNLLDFAARMWRGSVAMQELQSLELGYRIELTGTEIGDLAAFVTGSAAQKDFSINEVPDLLKDWFVDEAYWDMGEWPDTEDWRFPR